MVRVLVLATLVAALPGTDFAQTLSVLHIKIVLIDPERGPMPVPRHELLVSDNPSTAPPRVILTALDGTAAVKLRPGNYTVESDHPVLFHGKAYQWTQIVDVVAGRDVTLELTAANAENVPITSAMRGSGASLEADPSIVLGQWQDSVVVLWTPYTRATGFVIDARGLVATSQRVVGTVSSVEVQLTPAIKVQGSVLASDSVRDVAILRVNPKSVASIRPVPLGCAQTAALPLAVDQEIFTIAAPLRHEKEITSGAVSRADSGTVLADFALDAGGLGGPVFTADGSIIGITSVLDEQNASRGEEIRVVPAGHVCEAMAAADTKMQNTAPPSETRLPVEPAAAFPVDALRNAAEKRAGSLSPYIVSSSDFDVSFITPVLTYGARYQVERTRKREPDKGTRTSIAGALAARLLMDFGNWSSYVEQFPPVLLVRATPKMAEGFWTMIGRGAARTQGIALPPFKHYKTGFSRLRAFCDDAEVTPIHPFKLELALSEKDSLDEGLYVFDPGTLGPQCGQVKLVLFSEKEPGKGDTRIVDPAVVQQIWQDFAPYRGGSR